ncbi:translocation/assembly module TamB [Belliella pelovolcani]|uniref:Translocation and assembly module TamB C-terminal domain-containing protein n=1 Tax=Belliella pelovolcani TaxID=529505 RepID=A0A1N7LEX1_9BACT|nr:translocation/assembly module TamB [Belliella pelovolcani]SIS72353.1 Family of unknown function [Belliella pelovolcani]
MLLTILLLLFVRSPWGQGIIVDKATKYLAGKTNTTLSIGRLFVTFQGNLYLDDFYVEDLQGDTLVYSDNLELGFGLMEFVKAGTIHINKFEWEGLKAKISRAEGQKDFNYQFLIDAFAGDVEEADQGKEEVESAESSPDPIQIKLSPIRFRDFDLSYLDSEGGTEAILRFKEFMVDVQHLDLEAFEFDVRALKLQQSQISYKQLKPIESEEEASDDGLIPLLLSVEKLTLDQVMLDYENQVDQQFANLSIDFFELSLPELDLQDQKVLLKSIDLKNSKIAFADFGTKAPSDDAKQETSTPFEWPYWDIEIGYIDLEDNQITYKTQDIDAIPGFFNPENMQFEGLNFNVSNVLLKHKEAKLALRTFNFRESSGFELKGLEVNLDVDDQRLIINDIVVETNSSKLQTNLKLAYQSFADFITQPESAKLDLRLKSLKADVRDAYFFQPDLAKDEVIQNLALFPILANGSIIGNLTSLAIPNLQGSWGSSRFVARGSVKNVLDVDQLIFDFPKLELSSDAKTITKFIEEDLIAAYQLPEKFNVSADAKGKLNNLQASMNLVSDLGEIDFKGKYRDLSEIVFEVALGVKDFQLGTLLKDPRLDTLTFTVEAQGIGASLENLNATLKSDFQRLKFDGNDYSGLQLEGVMKDGVGELMLGLESEYLDFELLTKLTLDTVDYHVDLLLDLKGADFFALGLTPEQVRGRLVFNALFDGNPEAFDLSTSLKDAIVVFNQRNYPLGNLDIQAKVREEETNFELRSLLLNGKMAANTSPEKLVASLTSYLRTYIDKEEAIEDLSDQEVTMELDFKLNQAPILNQVLLPGLEKLDTARLVVDFDVSNAKLLANLDFPYMKYGEIEIDSLGMRVNADRDDLNLAFGFLKLESGPLSMDRTYFTGELEDSRLFFDFNAFDGDQRMVHVASDIGLMGDTLSIHIDPEDLLLNKREWGIPMDNEVLIAENYLHFKNLRFFRNNQELLIRDDLDDVAEEHVALEFRDFRLETFTSLFNPDELIAGGLLNGKLVVENPFGAIGILANLKVQDLKALDVGLGNLSMEAVAANLGEYQLKLALKDGGIDLDLAGDFVADETGGEFDLDIAINRVEMKLLADLSKGEIRNADGYISGKVNASGNTNEPNYNGELVFNEAEFVVAQLNARYMLPKEVLKVDNAGLSLNQFTIRDENGQKFIIDGKILTEDFTNPKFDLKLKANGFRAVNSSREDNDLFYGTAILDADVTIRGDLNLPRVTADLSVKDGTNFNVIIPETQLDLVKRDGTVIFVNRQDPYDILTRQTDEMLNTFTGYDVRSVLKVDPNAVFKIIVDERSGDNLSVSGEANLNLEINPNGRITLSGTYELSKGHYEMSLYNLVNRRFEIAPGSTIAWNGDPMDANMNISAIYNVRTPSAELMASQLSGTSADARLQYQQELPFQVYLNVGGEILKPEISFRLDMPEDQRGAMGGNVYSRVSQINEQEDELNKQVFSLLVLNRFFPSTGSDGSGGGTAAIARNSVSQVLSGQLNALSSSVFGNTGLELDFDLDSFTDYQSGSAQDRTQLNVNARKRFFDDRLIVQVGSQMDVEGSSQNPEQANAVLGNISLEYVLTENGRYRVRAFRKNQFESIIDGQLIVTGFGLIFNREFNRFYELWRGVDLSENGTNPIDKLQNGEAKKENQNEKSQDKKELDVLRKEENED